MELETERLIIAPLELSDAPFFLELVNDPDWIRYIGDRQVNTLEDAEAYLKNRILPSYSKFGFGFHKVCLKSNNLSIGITGIIHRENLDHPDIGFAFLPTGRNKGYAFESTKAIYDLAVEQLGIEPILAIANQDNESSHRLLNKLGLRRKKLIQLTDEDQQIYLFTNKAIRR